MTWGDWPKELASQFSRCATLWSLGYPAPLLERQLGTIEKGFTTEGHDALTELVHAGLGKRPFVFVTHSLGGLLAKAIIARAASASRGSSEYSLFANTHAVIFAATHAGSGQASWADTLLADHSNQVGDETLFDCVVDLRKAHHRNA